MWQHAAPEVQRMVVGNKCDESERRRVDWERGQALAAELGLKFLEASAKTNTNVDTAFVTLARDIKARVDQKTAAVSLENQLRCVKMAALTLIKCVSSFGSK
ncbi:RAB8A [Cordylochernes scorpioides]|uniref:RAB8A n=1 Tax=Cordylochernes scorpioides TaxID=51811 RepID=A0ABY6LAF7_9ARAC|nr:RAB8A [Cordylochernes scorpioides]